MGFLDTVQVPTAQKKATSSGGFLGTVVLPTAAQSQRAVQIQQLTTQARKATEDANKTNSLGGILSNTFTLNGLLTPQNLFGGAKEIFSDVKTAITQPLEPTSYNFGVASKTNPVVVPQTFVHSFASAIQEAGDKLALAYDSNNYSSFSKGTATLGSAGVGIISGLFAPVTATLAAASKIPVIGVAAGALNNLFGAIGAGGAGLGEGIIDTLPISDEAKDNLRPFAQEAGALVAQIVAGKASPKAVPLLKEKTTQILNIVKEDVSKRPTAPGPAPVGPNAATLPPEPVPQPVPKGAFLDTVEAPKGPAEGLVPNTRAVTLERAAVERKLTDTLGDTPGHEQINMAEQAQAALDFIQKNPKAAERIAVGDSISPPDIRPEAIYTALEIKAIKEGDINTLMNLKDSKIPTLAGQALKSLDSVDPDSPVSIMRSIEKAREASVKDNGNQRSSTIKDIRTEIAKASSKRPAWEDFIKEIQCGY